MIRYVTVQLVGRPDEETANRNDRERFDHEGLFIYWSQRVDLNNETATIKLEGTGFYPVAYEDMLQSKLRFGDFAATDFFGESSQPSLYITGACCDRQHRACLNFTLEVGNAKAGRASLFGSIGGVEDIFTLEDYSYLSGMPMAEILAMVNFDEANERGYFSLNEKPFLVDVDVLAEMYGGNFHFELCGVNVPFEYIKKKCHFL